MIQAQAMHQANVLLLEITYPGNVKVDFKTITGDTPQQRVEAAKNYVYTLNKNYISVKICSWLKQRMFGLQEYDPARSQQAAKLLVLLNYYNQFNYFKLCRLIAEHRPALEFIAPKEQSKSYPYYKAVIVPILDECDIMKGEPV